MRLQVCHILATKLLHSFCRFASKNRVCFIRTQCSDKADSILQSKATKAMEEFCWNDVIGEMKLRAPTLLSLLQSCTRTKKARRNMNCVIGLIAALLCKHRRPSASLVQRLISVILYSGHASKRVSFNTAILLVYTYI